MKPLGPDDRIRPLLTAATSGQDMNRTTEAWGLWRSMLPDLDLIEGPEISVVPVVSDAVLRDHPDDGRLRGLRRRATTHAVSLLAVAAHRQEKMLRAGIASVLTGGAAAALAYPATARWTTPTADLRVAKSALPHLGVVSLGTRERALGRTPVPGDPVVTLRWREPDRAPTAPIPGHSVIWQGRSLTVAPAHMVAYHCLLRGLLVHRPGRAAGAQALIDLHLLSRRPDFDPSAFHDVVTQGGWRGVLAQHAHAWRGSLPDRDLELLTGVSDRAKPHPKRQGRWRAEAVPAAHRVAMRWIR